MRSPMSIPPMIVVAALLFMPGVSIAQSEEESALLFKAIKWQVGPCVGKLGNLAEIQVPDGMAFTGKDGTRKFLEATQNLPDENALGVVVPTADSSFWWVVFEYSKSGHIADDEKTTLDAAAMLRALKENNSDANKERRKRGWDEIEIVGWQREPFYDERSNNLTWAIRGRSTNGESVNHSVRLLGREGYMSADMVLDPEEIEEAVEPFDNLLTGFSYTTGHRYSEYRKGDKLAAYGLTALVAGGAGAVAAKTGLLGKLWKLIVVGVLAIFAAVRRFFSAIFSWGKSTNDTIEPK